MRKSKRPNALVVRRPREIFLIIGSVRLCFWVELGHAVSSIERALLRKGFGSTGLFCFMGFYAFGVGGWVALMLGRVFLSISLIFVLLAVLGGLLLRVL